MYRSDQGQTQEGRGMSAGSLVRWAHFLPAHPLLLVRGRLVKDMPVTPKVGISHFLYLSSIARDSVKAHYLITLMNTTKRGDFFP